MLAGELVIPLMAEAIIVFSHGSGSSRFNPRNQMLAGYLHKKKFGTLLFDLLTEEDLQKEYPLLVLPQKTSTGYFLVHLAAHLSYHLGQINYHRRLLDK